MTPPVTILNWVGRVISALVIAALVFSAGMKLAQPDMVGGHLAEHLGYPASVAIPLGVVELFAVILYAVPRTSALGAVLITGYLGGAIASHVRIGEGFVPVVAIGVCAWLGLYFRDERIRAVLPWRT